MIFTKKIFYLFFIGAFTFLCLPANCQSINTDSGNDTLLKKFQVRKIIISGNKKTKNRIIKREMQIKEGDSISASVLTKTIGKARQYVYNTTLFTNVTIRIDTISTDIIDLYTEVVERWYIYPVPQFQLVDRSLSDWINNHNADLSRTNYGIRFSHNNLTGRRDQLKFTILNGFKRELSFSYSQPYSNIALTEGFIFTTAFGQTKELAYKTTYDNKVLAFASSTFENTAWNINAGYIIRKGVKDRHLFNVKYSNLTIPDSILTLKYNPHYFNLPSPHQHIIDFSYSYQYVDVDNILYPLEGDNYSASVSKRGLVFTGGINMLALEASMGKYVNLKKNWYISSQVSARIKLPFDQPYINQQGLGYGENFLRGLENYVVDGVAYALSKTTLKKKILDFKINLPIKSKTFNKIPIIIFAKTYGDFGYAYTKKQYDTYLSNRFLYSGGIGLDILTVYDVALKFEYSFNQLGENGLFLRTQATF